jgi:hypothetical protein
MKTSVPTVGNSVIQGSCGVSLAKLVQVCNMK